MNNKLRPAMIAGGIMGVLGVVLGLVTALLQTPGEQPSAGLGAGIGCIGCLLMLGSGALAVYLYVSKSTVPATTGDGAVLGLLAGLTSAVIGAFATPISYVLNRATLEQQADQMRQAGLDLSPIALVAFSVIIGLIFQPLIAMLGGLLGVPLFEKRKGDAGMPPPPPPANYGGGVPPMSGSTPGAGTSDFNR